MDKIYITMAALAWYNSYELLRKDRINHKLSVNIIAGLHCLSVLFFNLCNLLHILNIINFPYYFSYIQNVSIGFYIYDTYLILSNMNVLGFTNSMHIYHHIVSIIGLSYDPDIYMFPVLFLWAEIGNFALFPTYHYIQTNDREKQKYWKKMQIYTYVPIRVVVFGYYDNIVYKNILYNDGYIYIYYAFMVIYLLGVYWSFVLLIKYVS